MIKRLSFLLIAIFLFHLGYAQVNAGFSANQTAGCPNPFLLVLSSTSTAPGPINSYSWQLTGPAGFTPQNSATNQLSTTLSIPGFYSVTLTVCSGGVCDTETQTNYIEVYAPPAISMNISPLVGCPPFEACFDGTFSPGCGTIISSVIDVRDGTVYPNVEDVCHTYTASGNYTNFTVSVTNSCGCVSTETYTEVVSVSPAPNASFSSSNSAGCTAPLNVNFNSTSTSVSGGTTYEWNIPPLVSGATGPNLSQSFPVGSYDVELIVTNPNGCADTVFQPAYVIVGNPQADFTSNNTNVCSGDLVNFSDLSTGNPIAWSWIFEGHGTSNQQNPSVTFNTSGSWNVSLVTQFSGGCSDSIFIPNYITVANAPINSFTVTDSGSCTLPFTTTFTSAAVNADSIYWSFPGGTPSNYSGTGPVNVSYNSTGSFGVTMTSFLAGGGCPTTTNFPSVISLNPLTATIVSDTINGCVPVTAVLDFVLSSSETVVSQNWILPGSDLGTSSAANPTAVYNAQGCYDVGVEVITLSGCTATVLEPNFLCAGLPPTGGFSLTPTSMCFEEEEVLFTYTGTGADTVFWDFGDGSTPVFAADDAVVGYPYSEDLGDFTVTMIPYNYGCAGDTTIYVDTVSILGPIAQFDADILSCADWNTFVFTSSAAEADSVFYEFGDPTTTLDTSSNPDPTWIYPAIDTITSYQVTQYAYNFTTGCVHQVSDSIRVYPPNAAFEYVDTVGCSPFYFDYVNTSLEYGPSPGFNSRWNWVGTLVFSGVGGGTVWTGGFGATRLFPDPGTYTVSLRNIDRRGCEAIETKTDLITVHGVYAGFTQDSVIGCAPFTVDFTDTSFAPVTYVDSWSWDFGVPGTTSDTSNLQNPSYTFTLPGVYTVTQTVTDSFGCVDTASTLITVTGSVASFSVSDTFFCTNQNIGLIDQSLGDSLSFNWTFVGGTPATSSVQNPPALSYSTEGFQDILLEVTDQFGCSDDTTVTVPVFDVVAQATASLDTIDCFANTTAISFTNTSFNNVDQSSVHWDLGNGTTSTVYNPSTVYNLAGNYVVSMSVASNTGCRDTTIVDTIFVGGPYAEIQIIDRDTACVCETIDFEILTVNATNPSFISGDGGIITYVPNGIIGDTIIDTISYQYCQTGSFIPQIFIDDGTCSGTVVLDDTVRIDSLVANFNVGPINACDTGTVCFTDSSYNLVQGSVGLALYQWDFGDGGTSNLADPCHTYTAPGLYDVQLSVLSNFNCRDTIVSQVYIPESPVVSYSQSDINGCIGLDLLYFDSTVVDTSTGIASWNWNFGNGDSSTLQNPSTVYNAGGLYTTTLTVVDSNGCVGTDSSFVDVFPQPTIVASNDTVLCLGDSAQLNASGGVSYSWIPNYNITDSSLANPIVFPDMDTLYVVEGRDVNGCPNWDSVFVNVDSIQALFSAPIVCLNETTPFTDLSTSSGTITNWSWNFGEPASGALDSSTLQNPSHDYLSQGPFDVTLSIIDDNLCTADTTIEVIVQDAPIASFTADSVCLGEVTSFNSDSSFAGGANIIAYQWNFGVGGSVTDTSSLPNPVYTYANPGLYTVCLTIVTDQNCSGNIDDTCFVVQVYELPNVDFTVDSACFGNAINFTDLTQAGADANLTSSLWDFGQNPEDTLFSTTVPNSTQFLYDTTGQYVVSLLVTDSNQCQSSATATAYVFANPDVDFSFTSSCQNQDNDFVSLPTPANSSSLSYYWDFDEGLGFQLGDSLETYAFTQTGNHVVSHVIVDALGCSDTIQQTIDVLAAPNALITGDNSVCRGTSTQLSAASSTVSVPPAVYDWSVTTSQTSTITYSPNADTQVFVTVTDANGCQDTTSILVDVLENPDVDFDWTNACEDIQFTINSLAQAGDAPITNYTWNINSPVTGPSTFNSVNVNYTSPTLDTLGATLIVEDANGCIDSLTQTIIVDEDVELTVLTPDFILCPSDSLLIDLGDSTQFIASGIGSTTWAPSTGVVSVNGDSIVLNPDNSTTYTLTAYSALNQCPPDADNVINVVVALDPLITVEATPNPILVGAVSNITAGVVPFNVLTDSLIWDNSSGTLNTDFGFLIEASPIEETTYPFQLIYYYDSVRCVEDTSITIAVITSCDGELIYVPNIFTPNNDGKNDEFRVTGYGIEVITYLRIFDRWGQLMFEGNDIEMDNGRMAAGTGWLGDNQNGKACNSGVYVYAYELICANGDVIKGSGNVTLIK